MSNELDEINKQGVSLIIGARNEEKTLALTIGHLMEECYSSGIEKFEIILMDNASTDETSRFFAWKATEKGRHWKYIYSPRGMVTTGKLRIFYDPVCSNVGTRNKGVGWAKYENIIFADAHIITRHGTIVSTLATLNKFGGIVHAPVSWLGADSSDPQPSYQYSYKVGEKIWGCVDEKTEILTRRGWLRWNEASEKDEYMTVNMDTQKLELQVATAFAIKEFDGEMVRIENKDIDMLLTPDHRTIIEKDGKFEIVAAKDVGKNKIPFKTEGYDGILWHDMIPMLGWIFTDGNYDREKRGNNIRNRVRIIQKKKENISLIEQDLELANVKYTKKIRKDGMTVFSIGASDSKEIIEKYPDRFFELNDLWSLQKQALETLWDRMMRADGHNKYVFYKTNKKQANMFQILTVLTGKGSRIRYKNSEGFGGNRYGKRGIYNVYSKKRRAEKSVKISKEYYKGKVWCPTVPNGTIIVRRNGKVTPTGQTWNRVKPVNEPFYIPLSGHCWLAVKKKEFLDKRGYPEAQRVYGGGEPYLDTVWWMTGSTSVVDPNSLVYHLSAGRGYNWHSNDLLHNMFLVSYILGGKRWIDRILITYINKIGSLSPTLQLLYDEAIVEGEEKKKWLDENKIMTFEELLRLDWVNDCEKCTKRGHPEPHPMRPWDVKNEELYGNHRSYVQEFRLEKRDGKVYIGNTEIFVPQALEVASQYL